MSRCGGAARQSLVLLALLVIFAAAAIQGCPKCLMLPGEGYGDFPIDQETRTLSIRFRAIEQFNFNFDFFMNSAHADRVLVPVSRNDNCSWRELKITTDVHGRPTIEIDGEFTSSIYPADIVRLFVSGNEKVLVCEYLSLFTSNSCPSNCGSVTEQSVTMQYVTQPGVTKPDGKEQPITTSLDLLEKHLDYMTLFILLAITVIVAVIAMIYATVMHYKYRKLVLRSVASPMLTFVPEYGQAEKQENNSELKSRLDLDFYLKEKSTKLTYPQQAAPHNIDLQKESPKFPPQRPKSHDSVNSIYDPAILS